MWKKILIILQCLLLLSTTCINIYGTTENQENQIIQETIIEEKEYITPDEYFKLFIKEFFPNEKFENENQTGYTSPYIQFLIEKNIIEPITYNNWKKGYYSLASFIDKSLLLLGYYDRPTDIINYNKKIQIIINDYGLDLKKYDLNKKITHKEAIKIINIFKNTKLNNIKNKYFIELPVKYKIDDYINKEKDFLEFSNFINDLKPNIIKFLNDNNYQFILTNKIQKYFPQKQNVTGTINFNTKKIYIQETECSTLAHEIGHAIHKKIISNSHLKKIYKLESNEIFESYLTNQYPDEYFARIFDQIYNNCYIRKNENKIEHYKKNNPIAFEIIYDCILNSEEINYKKIQNILKTKLK